jgi:iron complex outermembrane receptor protein
VPRRWFVDSANQSSAGSYTTIDVRAGVVPARSGLSVLVEGRNLTDRDYVSAVVVDAGTGRFFQPGDGSSGFGGVEWHWR